MKSFFRNIYHFLWALASACVFGFPSRRITVIGVTGTKGKSSTIEFLSAIFEEAGHKTALINSIRMKIADTSQIKKRRMSMPGRLALQRFFSKAIASGCDVALIEMTSEGALQHRHRFINLDCLVFTNLAPEHLDAHGTLEAYIEAKLSLGKSLSRSSKRPRIIIANADDNTSERFLSLPADVHIPFSIQEVEPYHADERGASFTFGGIQIRTSLPGMFSLRNALAAAVTARAFSIEDEKIVSGIAAVKEIPGRGQEIHEGQPFAVVVDYAHTPDSQIALYDAYKNKRLICVFGGAGGGRDLWKRPEMGKIAGERCAEVILTTEDPYDEDPRSIAEMIAHGMKVQPKIILDRRLAIREAFTHAQDADAVLITGKGSEPSIHVARGKDLEWSDEAVAREELKAFMVARKNA